MIASELFRDFDVGADVARPEADPFTEDDALQEAALVDVRMNALSGVLFGTYQRWRPARGRRARPRRGGGKITGRGRDHRRPVTGAGPASGRLRAWQTISP